MYYFLGMVNGLGMPRSNSELEMAQYTESPADKKDKRGRSPFRYIGLTRHLTWLLLT